MHSLATILFSFSALANIVLDCKSAEVDTCVKVCQEKCGEVFADVKLAAQCLKTHEIKCLFSFYELETSEIACLTKSEDESRVYVKIPKASIGTSDNQVLNTFTYGMFNLNDLNRSRDEPVLRIQGTASLTKTPDCNKNILPDPADSEFIDIEPNPNNPRQYPIQKIFSKLVSSDGGPRWVRLRLRFAPKNASDEMIEPARKRLLQAEHSLGNANVGEENGTETTSFENESNKQIKPEDLIRDNYSMKSYQKYSRVNRSALKPTLDGTETTTIPDPGSTTTISDPGSTTTIPDPGSTTTIPDPGSTTTISDPGSTTIPDGPGSTTTIPDGPGSTTTIPDGPGSTTTIPDPGSTTTISDPGSTTIPDGPGSTTTIPDCPGSTITTIAVPRVVPTFEQIRVPIKVDGSLLSADGVIKTYKPGKRFRLTLWIVLALSVITIIGVSVLLWTSISAANARNNQWLHDFDNNRV